MARCCTGLHTPSTPGPWPAVLVIHGGVSIPARRIADGINRLRQDLAAAGYIAFFNQYRLAPPGFTWPDL
jgi:acetyl esterase/lipase